MAKTHKKYHKPSNYNKTLKENLQTPQPKNLNPQKSIKAPSNLPSKLISPLLIKKNLFFNFSLHLISPSYPKSSTLYPILKSPVILFI